MKILVLVLAALGDTLFTTPSLQALRNGYPDAEIDVIAWESSRDILLGNKNIDNLIVCKGKVQLLAELQQLRENVYDLAIGLSNIGSYLSYLVNARKRLGFKGDELGWMYDYNVPDDRTIHAVDYCLEIVKLVGAEPDENPVLELPFIQIDKERTRQKLKDRGVDFSTPILAIHPGGKYFSYKRWPVEKYRRLIKKIDTNYDWRIIIIGGKDDEVLAERMIDRYYNYRKRPVNMAGKLKIKETVALLSETHLFIGNDSSPMHMASAARAPVIALFGPTEVNNFHPYGTTYEVVRTNLSCSPCFTWLGELKQYLPEYLPEWASKCKASCMNEIKVEDVMERIDKMMAEILVGRNSQDGYQPKLMTGGNL